MTQQNDQTTHDEGQPMAQPANDAPSQHEVSTMDLVDENMPLTDQAAEHGA